MNRRARSLVATALALVVIASLLGCETQPAAPATPTTQAVAMAVSTTKAAAAATTAASTAAPIQTTAAPAAAASTEVPGTIKLGIMTTLQGPTGVLGIALERFHRMAVDDVNAKGGIKVSGKTYRFEAVTADDKASPEGGLEAANRLVLSEKVRFMAGSTSGTFGAQSLLESSKVLNLVTAAQDSQLGLKSPYTFGVGYPNVRMMFPALYGQLTKNYPNAKRVALIYDETVNGRPASLIAQETAKSAGLTVLATEYYPPDIKDFGPLVTRVLAQNPDAIDIGSASAAPQNFLSLMKALAEQGYKKPVFGLSGTATALQQAGPAAEGYFFAGIADQNSPLLAAGQKDIMQRFIQKYGQAEFQIMVMGAYTNFSILAQAMEKAGTVDDIDKIVNTLREGQWDTMWGKKGFSGVKTFGLPAFLDMNIYLSKVEGGKLVTFDSFNGTLP